MAIGTHNTSVTHLDNGNIAVDYMGTRIVIANPQTGEVQLDNGGWITATTARRMNELADTYSMQFQVSRRGGKMRVHHIVDGVIMTTPFTSIEIKVTRENLRGVAISTK